MEKMPGDVAWQRGRGMEMQERLTVDIICIIVVVCVLVGCAGTFDRKLQENKIFLLINVLVIVMLIADLTSTFLLLGGEIPEGMEHLRTFHKEKDCFIMLAKDFYYLSFYCLLCLSCLFLGSILKGGRALRLLIRLSIPIAVISVVCLVILNYHTWMVHPTEMKGAGYLPRDVVEFGAHAGGSLIVASCILLVLRYRQRLGVRQTFSLLAFMVLPSAALIFSPFLSMSVHMALMYSLSLLIYFVLVRLENAQQSQRREVEMATQRLQMTMRLVQPHFLCNTLTSIYYLCDKDPYMAKEAMGDFAHYLRGNMQGITTQSMIPFERELEHVKYYIHLEQLRFGEEVQAVYDIQASDFKLPALSIEPLVENSVKHGLYEKDGGGTIWISTFAAQDDYHILVEDDGIGFDPLKQPENPTEHLGLRGVKERLLVMCGGTMQVSSLPGQGTRVELVIPRKKGEEG